MPSGRPPSRPLKPKHAAAADKLKAIYTEFEAQLVEVLPEAKAVDAEVHRVGNAKPHHLPQANGDGAICRLSRAPRAGYPASLPTSPS